MKHNSQNQQAYNSLKTGTKLLSVLLDPDKCLPVHLPEVFAQLPEATTHIFVGGSTVDKGKTHELVSAIRGQTQLPVWIFPGDADQITPDADALLFLSLVSGDNPEYLIGQQAKAARKLRNMHLPVIGTAYVLIDGGHDSAVARVTGTAPMSLEDPELILDRVLAAQFMGAQYVYLEAGSGAAQPIPASLISMIKKHIHCPLIVGGGLRTSAQMKSAWDAGADMLVVGTALEEVLSLR